ncbi:MAG: T9SS type A sorting domain-containing protein [Bacteroidetes bacterium]|nr:T9SS type A sorting domain-containing protein [Bacteroidota bacterium]
MKNLLLLLLFALPTIAWTQCNTSNATDCDCLDGSDDCDLLPDILASHDLLADPEYQPESVGLLGVSVSTPNLGHGPLRVFPTDYFICGGDTVYSPGGLDECPDGSAPHQIINQRIYHKNGTEMTYWERNAGTVTYHPTHGHFHVDDWGVYSLRIPVEGVENPLEWPIIGEGSKLGFCLMDYGTCTGYYGYYRDADNNIVTTAAAPNSGLGGGNFSCGITNQGISCGQLDIYHYWLDGMNIILPPGICNGDYKIVVQVDPNNYFLEENDENNVMVADITLTEQLEDITELPITITGDASVSDDVIQKCGEDVITLSVTPIGTSYLWNNGATTSSITVTEPGSYNCTISRTCGDITTSTIEVTNYEMSAPVIDPVELVCAGTSTEINATASGEIIWYDAAVGGSVIGSGATLSTSDLFETTSYFAANTDIAFSAEGTAEPHEITGGSPYSEASYNGYLVFDVTTEFTLISVKVYTDTPGDRTIELRNAGGTVLQSATVNIPTGESTATLNFDIAPGSEYVLGTNTATNLSSFGYEGPRLERASTDAGATITYPYNVGGLATITESSYEARYYYFFDWEYNAEKSCTSARTEVTVNVEECTGISEVAGIKGLAIYPNPNNGNFNVQFETNTTKNLTIQVSNTLGQIVYSNNYTNASGVQTYTLQLQHLAKGIYTLGIISDGKAVNKQVVIE